MRLVCMRIFVLTLLIFFIKAEDELTLPDWCYDPPGTDCKWYTQCLVPRYSCEATNDSYAIGFGDTICNAFNSWRPKFTEVGQHWVDDTRACLQKALVPVLRPDTSMTCAEIQSYAFNTHVDCYIDPPSGSTSFCDLPFTDWFRITWIVKESFVRETSEAISQATTILGKCASHGLIGMFA